MIEDKGLPSLPTYKTLPSSEGSAFDGSLNEERDTFLAPPIDVEDAARHPSMVEPVEVDLVTLFAVDVYPCQAMDAICERVPHSPGLTWGRRVCEEVPQCLPDMRVSAHSPLSVHHVEGVAEHSLTWVIGATATNRACQHAVGSWDHIERSLVEGTKVGRIAVPVERVQVCHALRPVGVSHHSETTGAGKVSAQCASAHRSSVTCNKASGIR